MLAVLDTAGTVLDTADSIGTGVDMSAHLGGFLVGNVLGLG